MRHSRDIVQACPGGGPVIPNQSLAVQRLERKIRTQEFRFCSFFQWMLNSKTAPPPHPPPFLLLASHQLWFHFIHHYLHIILIISTLSLMSHDGFIRLCVVQTFLGANVPDRRHHKHRRKYDLFLLLCWVRCNILQMNTDLFKCINSFIWPKLRSSAERKLSFEVRQALVLWTLTHLIRGTGVCSVCFFVICDCRTRQYKSEAWKNREIRAGGV